MKEIELKPCPFCGHKASVYCVPYTSTKFNPVFSVEGIGSLGYDTTTKVTKYAIRCNKCKCAVGAYTSRKSAENAWNRRVNNEQREAD